MSRLSFAGRFGTHVPVRRGLLIVAVVTAVLVSPSAVDSASAFPSLDPVCVPRNPAVYEFDSSVPSSKRAAIAGGLELWETVKGLDGQPLVSVSEGNSSNSNVLIKMSGIGTAGGAVCIDPNVDAVITLNVGLADPAELRYAAAHEMGHVFGLHHTGTADNLQFGIPSGAPYPIMQICKTDNDTTLRGDDYAALGRRIDGGPSSPNHDFDHGMFAWYESSASQVWSSAFATGGVTGGHMRFRHNAGIGAHMLVEARQSAAWGNIVGGSASIRKSSTSHIGEVTVQTWYRGVNHAAQSTPTCPWPIESWNGGTEFDANQAPSSLSAWLVHQTRTCTPVVTWTSCATSGTTIGITYPSIDMQVKLFSSVRTAGSSQWDNSARRDVLVDNVYINMP